MKNNQIAYTSLKYVLLGLVALSVVVLTRGIPAGAQIKDPELRIPRKMTGVYNNSLTFPVILTTQGHELASMAFSIDIEENCIGFDPTDSNSDGIPDDIELFVPPAFNFISVSYDANDEDGEIDILIGDVVPPLALLQDGVVAEITVTTTCIHAPGDMENITINFSPDPSPSFSDPQGNSITPDALGGTILYTFGCGDINRDGIVGIEDAVIGLQFIAELLTLDRQQLTIGNLTGDEFFNVGDVIMLLNHIVGISEIAGCSPTQ